MPTPDQDKSEFGGNTPCVSFQLGREDPIVLDAGTGIRLFGNQPSLPGETLSVAIIFSHFHWDHIQGFPFFQHLYSEHSHIRLYSAFTPAILEQTLRGQMREPYFPIPYSAIRAQLQYEQIDEDGVQINGVHVRPIGLNHPGGCFGFRLNSPAGSAVYATDHEHGIPTIDSQIAEISSEADILIPDAHFTPAEYQTHRGWGHSTWLESCSLAAKAGVHRLLLFHHSPSRTDKEMEMILAQAREHFPAVEAAREGAQIVLSRHPTRNGQGCCRP